MRLLAVLPLSLLIASCAHVGVGPTVDADWCARAVVDDAAVVRALNETRAQSSFESLEFSTFNPSSARGVDAPPTVPSVATVESRISTAAPVFLLPDGKARGVGLVIPKLSHPATELVVVPQPSGRTVAHPLNCAENRDYATGLRLIDPVAVFLDATKRQIGSIQPGEPSKLGNLGARRFSIPETAGFVVILHNTQRLGERIEFVGDSYMTILPVGGLFVPMPASGTIRGIRSSTGSLSATFR
jgi:hypothetical protein